jgi:hypothetical protein
MLKTLIINIEVDDKWRFELKTFLETQGNSLNFILGIRTNDSQ